MNAKAEQAEHPQTVEGRPVGLLEETRVVPMPAVAGWSEAERVAHQEGIRASVARAGGRIVKERRYRNTAFDRRGEKTSWEFVVEWSATR